MNPITLFNSLTSLQRSLVVSILSIVLFISSAGVSHSFFTSGKLSLPTDGLITSLPGVTETSEPDAGQPKTETCPLNGSLQSKMARDAWEKRRPLAVMIENHQESRPQSGLTSADVIYEAVAEGGITRFMALFYCNLAEVQIGPVRSARTYFLDWQGEYDSLYVHVGGANTPGPADALGQIIRYGVKDLNQFGIGFPTFWRDYQRLGHPVATEHTMYSTTKKLWEVGTKKGWTNLDEDKAEWSKSFVLWKFKDPASQSGLTAANKVDVNFWSNKSDYQVVWEYDPTNTSYKRSNGGQPHTDLNNKKNLLASNVIIQFQRESNANDGYENNVHLLYKTIGEGKALIFQDGVVIEGKWVKSSRLARTKYLDAKGKEVSFNKGQIWIQTVPEGATISY